MNKDQILATGSQLDIIHNEIEVHSKLLHPNITRLFSYHEDPKAFYLIMEYAEAGTLFTLIKKTQGLSEDKVFKYFIQTANAVFFIHENNLVHRDIKPENILIDKNDNVKLCDFGWTAEQSMGSRLTFCGTYEYMAPEIIKEIPYNHGIDVWSLGILLYEMTHGYSPFRAKGSKSLENDQDEIFSNIMKNKFKIENKNLSEDCRDLIKSNIFIKKNFCHMKRQRE
jgi:serine/threonine protein kinase